MVLPLNNFHLCFQRRAVQRGRDLADASSDTVYHLAVFICGCSLVSIGSCKGLQALIARKHFSGHHYPAVDLGRSHGKIGGTGCSAAGKVCGTGAKHILDGRQFLRCDLRLLLRDHRVRPDCSLLLSSQRLIQRLNRSFRINRAAGNCLCNHKSAVFPAYGGILRLRQDILAVGIHKSCYLLKIYCCFNRKLYRSPGKIFLYHILADQAASGVLLKRFLNLVLIAPVKSQLLCRGLLLLSVQGQDNRTVSQFLLISLYYITGLPTGFSCQILPLYTNPVGKYRSRHGCTREGPHCPGCRQDSQGCFPHFIFHSHISFSFRKPFFRHFGPYHRSFNTSVHLKPSVRS